MTEVPREDSTAVSPRDESRAITDTSRLQLWFEQFRDLALIELALAGGIITLLGTVFQDVPRRGGAFVGVVALGFGAVCALIAQAHVVDLSNQNKPPDKMLRRLRSVDAAARHGDRRVRDVRAPRSRPALGAAVPPRIRAFPPIRGATHPTYADPASRAPIQRRSGGKHPHLDVSAMGTRYPRLSLSGK